MVMTGESQSILVSGESGAGKTESTKLAMGFLAGVANGGSGMEHRVLGTNVILEAFGNAKTVFNNNSSRFGKLIKIHFDSSNNNNNNNGRGQVQPSSTATTSIVGAEIKTYLLEKSRVVKQAPNERNFHIFYQLCSGCCDSDPGQQVHLGDPSAFAYLKQCTGIKGVEDKAGFQQVCEAMKGVGILEEHQHELWRTLAAILWLGNIEFAETSDEEGQDIVRVSELTVPALTIAAELLGCSSSDALASALTHQRLVAGGGDVIAKRRDVVGAMDARDALAKALYQAMFTKLVEDINLGLLRGDGGGGGNINNSKGKGKKNAAAAPTAITSTGPCLSILDIAGFESLPSGNGFEQLCINYANERLQRQFNHHLFHLEQSVYNEEGIDWAHIPFEDNQACVDLLEARGGSNSSSAAAHKQKQKKGGPAGVFALLDEECLFPKGSDTSFASKLKSTFGSTDNSSGSNGSHHPHFAVAPLDKAEEFSINHFAGPVKYNSTGFLEKNKDNLSHELLELGQHSCRVYVQQLAVCLLESKASTKATSNNNNQVQTVGGRFREQLHELMEHLDSTALHFVRCIKPNNDQCATQFNSPLVLHQLRCCGVGEVARIARAGYPTRLDHATFAKRYSTLLSTPLLFDDGKNDGDGKGYDYKKACISILGTFNISEDSYRLGRTRIFFRAGVLGLMEDKTARMIRSAVCIQAYWRMKVAERRYREVRVAVEKIQAGWKGCVTRRWYEEMVGEYTVAAVTMQAVYRGRVARVRVAGMRREREEEAMRQRMAREEKEGGEDDTGGDVEAITVRQHKSLEEEFNMSRNEIKAVLGLWTENGSAFEQWIVAHCPKDPVIQSAASGGILPIITSSPGGDDTAGTAGEEEEGGVLETKLSLMEQYALKLEAKYKQSAQEVSLLRRALTTMEAAVPNDSPKKAKSRAVLHAATARIPSNTSAYLLLSAESSCDMLDFGDEEGGGSYVSEASSMKPTPRVLSGRGTGGGGGIASRMVARGGQKDIATTSVGDDENGQGHNVPPPATKEQAGLGVEFERRRALFNDDADFIRDVASGKVNPAKEMSSDAELAKLLLRYKRWKKEFKGKLKAAQQAVASGGGNGSDGGSREKPAFGARLKSQLMLSKKSSALHSAR